MIVAILQYWIQHDPRERTFTPDKTSWVNPPVQFLRQIPSNWETANFSPNTSSCDIHIIKVLTIYRSQIQFNFHDIFYCSKLSNYCIRYSEIIKIDWLIESTQPDQEYLYIRGTCSIGRRIKVQLKIKGFVLAFVRGYYNGGIFPVGVNFLHSESNILHSPQRCHRKQNKRKNLIRLRIILIWIQH